MVHLHGSIIDPETIIITEKDYLSFYASHPVLRNLLGGLLAEKTLVFLGYSLEDPDFDQLYHDIATHLGDFQRLSYAVQLMADGFTEAEWTKFHVDLWTRRKIRVITGAASNFLQELDKKLHAPAQAVVPPGPPKSILILERPNEVTHGNRNEAQNILIETPPLQNCSVEVEVRMESDGGDNSNWFGVRVRGVTSWFHAGYLVYLRSNSNLDVTSIEERSILEKEVPAIDPKEGFVHLKITIIAERIKVWVNGNLVVDKSNTLVSWPGYVYLHTFATTVKVRALQIFNEIVTQ